MRLTIVLSTMLLIGSSAAARDLTVRSVNPVVDWSAESLERFDAEWLHVKFVEGSAVEIDPVLGVLVDRSGRDLTAVTQLLADAVAVRRTFSGPRAKFRAWKTQGEAASGQAGPDLSLWFDVRVVNGRGGLAEKINALNALAVVEIAHPAPICEPASVTTRTMASTLCLTLPAVVGATPDFSAMQGYLYDTPVGLDAPRGGAMTGGHGAQM